MESLQWTLLAVVRSLLSNWSWIRSQPDTGWQVFEKILAISADVGTIAASILAFYLFLAKGSEIRAMVRAIANFAHQGSLGEIRQKLDVIASLRVLDDQEEIVSVFHDICGQIDGNPKLKDNFDALTRRVRKHAGARLSLTEPQKRALVSELREKLRHSDVSSIADAMGDSAK